MKQGVRDHTFDFMNKLTIFLISHEKELKNLDTNEIFNKWTSETNIHLENSKDVVRCLSLIKDRDKIYEGKKIINQVIKEEL